ncbi:Acetyltransferase (GNAT) family protein [Candidatus Anstonella stagnisolia]|nr:Acetyltransferase (GNAT) family protein [Candidatus Anstonella stagnisolia]
MEILPFEQKYQNAVLALNELAVGRSEYIGGTVDPNWHGDLGKIKEDYLGNNGAFLLWLDGGRLVGMGGLLKIDAGTANVKRVRVHPDYQRKGLSAEILAELERRARLLGYRKLVANTAKGNVPAEKMFMKAGFKPVGEKEFFSVPCTLFEKRLALLV